MTDIDETVVAIAELFKAALSNYEGKVAIFKDAREARKGGTSSPRLVISKVERHSVDDEVKQDYMGILADFIEALGEIAKSNPGILAIAFNDLNKGGRIFDFVLNEATDVASTIKSDDPVPSIEELVKAKDRVNGLWTALESSADIDALKELGINCEITKKGRAASGDKETWRPVMSELPKVSKGMDSNVLLTLTRNGTPIWETKTDGSHEKLSEALKREGVKFSDFETQMQLAGQTLSSVDFLWKDDHYLMEEKKVD